MEILIKKNPDTSGLVARTTVLNTNINEVENKIPDTSSSVTISVLKAMAEHISCDCKCKFSSTIRNSHEKWNNKTYQCECKNYRTCKKDNSWNSITGICDNSKCL